MNFEDLFTLIAHTPNLEYLNIQLLTSFTNEKPINEINIKLKQLYLKFSMKKQMLYLFQNSLINVIKMFRSSLTCLSLDLVDVDYMTRINDFPFDSIKLQQLLESIIELKQFHLYAKYSGDQINNENIISRFENQYWFDQNYSFGMHGKYFYTLPFHFDYLYEFYGGFDDVISNNYDILINNSRLWYHVKAIDLTEASKTDSTFVKQLKINMPKLTFIKFHHDEVNRRKDFYIKKNMYVKLDNVTSVKCPGGSLENGEYWLTNILPNLTQLILFSTELPLIHNEQLRLLCGRIQRLDIDVLCGLEELTIINYIYFFNVQHISFNLHSRWRGSVGYGNIIMKLLEDFKQLKSLLIYNDQTNKYYLPIAKDVQLGDIVKCLDMKTIRKNYQMKKSHYYLLFLKQKYENDKIQDDGLLSTLREWLSFSNKN